MRRSAINGALGICRAGLKFVYPETCPLCDVELARQDGFDTSHPFLCSACRQAVTPDVGNTCLRCGSPVGPYVDTSNGCSNCASNRFSFESVIKLGLYEDRLREACIRGKSPGSEPLMAAVANLLWEQERNAFHQAGVDLVLPVPRYWMQRITRPHNPAATLARVLARRLKVDFSTHILCKTRKTPDQSSLSSQQRRMNLRNAFRVRGTSRLAGLTILLVDDILTTGTTANESSKALRRAGAKRVVVAVAAVVPK